MSTLVDQIRENSPDLTELRLAEEVEAYSPDVHDLISALQTNTVIDYVRLDRDFLPSMSSAEDTQSFFQAFGKLSNLKEAQIWHAAIHVSVLADFIKATYDHLEHLQLGCLDLAGNEQDFDVVAQALRGHPKLQSFCMSDFSLNNNSIVLDGLIETLSTLPQLAVVKLEVTHARRRSVVGSEAAAEKVSVSISGKALAVLCQAPCLEELYLNRLNLSHADFQALAQSIHAAPKLRMLALPHCNLDDEACIALAVAIGQSKTLQKIDMSCNKLTDEGCVTLASGLKGNASVTFLRLWGNVKISNAGFDAVREMLEQNNCVLERVPLMSPGIGYEPRINTDTVERKPQAHAA